MQVPFMRPNACVEFRANSSTKHKNIAAWGVKDSFLIHTKTDLQALDTWLNAKKGSYVFCALSFELYQLLPFFEGLTDAPTFNEPLAIFWEAENVGESLPNVNTSFNLALGQEKENHSKESYHTCISQLQKHIALGDFYITNFCNAYRWQAQIDNPYGLYNALNKRTLAPFSVYFKWNEHHIISASPERFVEKKEDVLSSSPIKGTIKRGHTESEDKALKSEILANTKELAENVMIVDLVRNDLAHIAERNSVSVDELNTLYSYKTVHQLVSTVHANVKKETLFSEILSAMYPMGSMTGAPKLESLKITTGLEGKPRGYYSGSVGYIAPNGDFDFNVVIRSFYYNQAKEYLHLGVGSAITSKSIPELEWEECQLKAAALKEVLHEYSKPSA